MLQAIAHLACHSIDSIGWVSYGGWMLKLEGSKWVYLEVYLEKWFLLSALMIFTWHIAERFVHCWYGLWAWELFNAQYAPYCWLRKDHQIPLLSQKRSSMLRVLMTHGQEGQHDLIDTVDAAGQSLGSGSHIWIQQEWRVQPESHCSKGYLSIKDVSLPDQDMVRLQAVMQDLPQGLLGSGESNIFIVDSGASWTSTFDSKDFIPGSLKVCQKPPVLTGISGTLEIKGQGDIKF